MALDFSVYTIGGGDVMVKVFNVIAAVMGGPVYLQLIKIVGMLGLAWSMFEATIKRQYSINAKWLIKYLFLFNVLFIPQVTVHIEDSNNPGKALPPIGNVPLAIAAFASYSSAFGVGLTELIEPFSTLPDDLQYSKSGYLMASKMVLAANEFRATDPIFNHNLQEFIQQCVFYDIHLGRYTLRDILENNNSSIWEFLLVNAAKSRAFMYSEEGVRPMALRCDIGAAKLNDSWDKQLAEVKRKYAHRLFPAANSIETTFVSTLLSSYNYLTRLSMSASEIMKQNIMMNVIQDSLSSLDAKLNAPAALEALAFERSQAQIRMANKNMQNLASHWLPYMKICFEGFLYGAFIFVFLLSLFPFGEKVLKNYLMSMLWIQLWPPCYAILNIFTSTAVEKSSLGVMSSAEKTLNFVTSTGLMQVNADIASTSGYLTMLVPLLASMIFVGFIQGFTHAAQYIGGLSQSAGMTGAMEATSGNFSLGNTQFDNHSAYNSNAFHMDMNARALSGAFSTQLQQGSIATLNPGGNSVIDTRGGTSNLPTSVNLSNAIRSQATTQSEMSLSAAQTDAQNYSSSLSSAYREMLELGQSHGVSYSSGDGFSTSESTGQADSLNETNQLIDNFANSHNITKSQASKALVGAYIDIKGGTKWDSGDQLFGKVVKFGTGASVESSVTLGGKGDLDHSWSKQDSDIYNHAKDYISQDAHQSTLDRLTRDMQENHFRSNTEEGSRILNNIGANFDRAEQARHDMSAHLQEAQNYREMASFATENAATINTNASQAFATWLQAQASPFSHGINAAKPMGAAGVDALNNHPELLQTYAEQYLQEKSSEYMHNWNAPNSANSVHNNYQNSVNSISGVSEVNASYSSARDEISSNKSYIDSVNQQIDTSLKDRVTSSISDQNKQLASERHRINEQSNARATEVKSHDDEWL